MSIFKKIELFSFLIVFTAHGYQPCFFPYKETGCHVKCCGVQQISPRQRVKTFCPRMSKISAAITEDDNLIKHCSTLVCWT